MMRNTFRKLETALAPAIWILPLFGILEGIGYALCPSAMQGGAVVTLAQKAGWIIARIASAVYDNRGFIFAISAGYMLSGKRFAGAAGGLIGVMLFNTFTSASFFLMFFPSVLDSPVSQLALYGPGAFTGLLLGVTASMILKRWPVEKYPVKCIIIGSFILTGLSLLLITIRIFLFHQLVRLGTAVVSLGLPGTGIFAVLNRLLAPFDLHRPLNYAVLSDAGAGDLGHYWGLVTDGDPGRYMAGFFPPTLCGVPAACLLLSMKAKKKGKRMFRIFALLCMTASFTCGLCEGFEYWLLLASPLLFLCNAVLYGISAWICGAAGFRAGFACSGGFTDLLFSAAMPAAKNTWMIIPIGLLFGLLFFLLFYRLYPDEGEEFDIIEAENREVL